ncbi:hypothetical protein [Catenovulum maritimum]|uniref:Uncharacterized protein n=1 Tax=Catenovulum maritimum TaxID=1513271 RepID=A0A0J8JJ09_9ALTE|nr:hypothetical protein [Catenovulum maritimum]KMT64446.1 hypothetical protein XM47_14205 [Catenovulum maritimum]
MLLQSNACFTKVIRVLILVTLVVSVSSQANFLARLNSQASLVKHDISKTIKVEFSHKASVDDDLVKAKLHEYQIDDVNFYYMDVKSVFCGENICKVDKVRLHWDQFGHYHELELGTGIKLEKGNALDFELEDYIKLDQILANKNSTLSSLEKFELVTTGSTESAGIDGFSGATTYIKNEDYIKGAIWTCYTLWHYVNGPVSQIIRNMSAESYSVNELTQMSTGSWIEQHYALEQLSAKQSYDAKTIEKVLSLVSNANLELSQAIISYVKAAPKRVLSSTIIEILSSENSHIVGLALNLVKDKSRQDPLIFNAEFYQELVKVAASFKHYPYVHQTLSILQQSNLQNSSIQARLLTMLESDNFMIARAVYWHLLEFSELNSNKMMQSFYQFNQDRL